MKILYITTIGENSPKMPVLPMIQKINRLSCFIKETSVKKS